MDNHTRSVLITGASKGIGATTALYLDALGFRVFAGVRTEPDAEALTAKGSNRLVPVMLDVTNPESITGAFQTVSAVTDRLAGVVNNAGVVVAAPMETLPLEHFRRQLEVNVVGALAVTQTFMPLVRAGRGRIVNVSSINGRLATPFAGAYASSKFALEGMSDALRMELRYWGIPVSVIQPGAVQTPIWETSTKRALAIAQGMSDDAKGRYGRVLQTLAGRGGRAPKHAIPPERVARKIAHALTAQRPKARYLVGWDARLGALLSALLPDRALDWILTRR